MASICPRGLVAAALLLASGAAHAEERPSTWVFFRDKGAASADVDARLRARALALSSRALDRRRRVRRDDGLDARDLDVAPAYVAAVRASGARIRTRSRWLNAVSVAATPRQLRTIRALPQVRGTLPVLRGRRIEPAVGAPAGVLSSNDALLAACGDCGVAFGQLDLLQVPDMHACGLTGAGVVVAVLDTGFVLAHQAFATLDVIAQHDFIHDDPVVEDEMNDTPGQHNHGTSVLSLLAGRASSTYLGVAPDVGVILAKTEDISMEQPIEEDWFVAGMEWAEGLGADLLTASLGYLDWYLPEDFDGQTAVTTQAVNVAVENGLIVLSAAGNEGPDPTTIIAPADAAGLIAVGAVDADGIVTWFSSRGPTADLRIKPDVCARGQSNWVVTPGTADQYEQGSGTSYATPMVAGVAALLLQAYPGLTPAAMHTLLTSTATRASTPDNDYGHGIVRALDAAGLYCTCRDIDADGYFDRACGGDDCDDAAAAVHPSATDICNGIDDDCDGIPLPDENDFDFDGVLVCAGDCDDGNAFARPGAPEVCDDDADNDCNGQTDEACPAPPLAEPPPDVEGEPAGEPVAVTSNASCDCRLAARPAPRSWIGLLGALWAIRGLIQVARRPRPLDLPSVEGRRLRSRTRCAHHLRRGAEP